MSDTAPAPALGFSIVANLGDNRQITCQCFVGVDEEPKDINARIDKVQNVIDRQRARYEVVDLRADRAKQATTLQRAEDDLARIEAEYQAGQTQFDDQINFLGEQIQSIDNEARARGRMSGPVGADASRKRTLQQEQKDLVAGKAKATAERDQYRQNVVVSIARFREAVAECDAKIAACEALLRDE